MESKIKRFEDLCLKAKDITKRMKNAFGKNGVEYLRLHREREAIKAEAIELAKELRKEKPGNGYRKADMF